MASRWKHSCSGIGLLAPLTRYVYQQPAYHLQSTRSTYLTALIFFILSPCQRLQVTVWVEDGALGAWQLPGDGVHLELPEVLPPFMASCKLRYSLLLGPQLVLGLVIKPQRHLILFSAVGHADRSSRSTSRHNTYGTLDADVQRLPWWQLQAIA